MSRSVVPPLSADELGTPAAEVDARRNGDGLAPHLDDGDFHDDDVPLFVLHTVTLAEFAAVAEPGADALLGDGNEIVIPANGDVMFYGAGGGGKTTLVVDLACHLGGGDDWLGIPVPAPVHTLVIENEGPRPNFRTKIRAKLDAWQGSDLGGRVRIVDHPWASLRLSNESHRHALADKIVADDLAVVIVGPLAAAGMLGHGTMEETRTFLGYLAEVRHLVGRAVAFIIVHHENRAGQVSGAWDGSGDTLIQVRKRNRGKTGMYIEKARWASGWHGKTMELVWADGETFTIEDTPPELSASEIAERITETVGAQPGATWGDVQEAVPGVRAETLRAVRDRMLTDGQLVNVITRKGKPPAVSNEIAKGATAHLYLSTDPTVPQPIPDADQVRDQVEK